MAIKINGTTVIDDSRNIINIQNVSSNTITSVTASFTGNTAILVPVGTENQRPANQPGLVRYNSNTNIMEYSKSDAWEPFQTSSGKLYYFGSL